MTVQPPCPLSRSVRSGRSARPRAAGNRSRACRRGGDAREAGLVGLLVTLEAADDRLLHAEGDVGLQVLVVVDEDLGDQRPVPGGRDDEVDMGWPVRVPVLLAQQMADRAVGRHRVAGRPHRAEPEAALAVGAEAAAQVHVGLVGILVVVEAHRRGLPGVDHGAGQGRAVDVEHAAAHQQRRRRACASGRCSRHWRRSARWRGRTAPAAPTSSRRCSRLLFSRSTSVETPSTSAASTTSLLVGVGVVPERGDPHQAVIELVLGRLHLADEGVGVADEAHPSPRAGAGWWSEPSRRAPCR